MKTGLIVGGVVVAGVVVWLVVRSRMSGFANRDEPPIFEDPRKKRDEPTDEGLRFGGKILDLVGKLADTAGNVFGQREGVPEKK